MAKKMMPKGKMVSGKKYVADDEKFDKKSLMKDERNMKTAGVAKALEKSEKDMGYSKKLRVKPQKKMEKPVSGQKKGY